MVRNPFNNTSPTIGAWNSSHSSNFTVAYTPLTLPRPWPYLLISFTVSTGLALWSIISNLLDHKKFIAGKDDPNKKPSVWDNAFGLAKIAFITYRAIAALVQAMKGIPSHNSTGGRVASSTLSVMFLSIIPYLSAYKGLYWIAHLRLLLFIDMVLVYIAMCSTLSNDIHPNWNQYGAWVASGTICPRYVPSCSSKEAEDARVGFNCSGSNQIALSQDGNHLANAELAIAWIGFLVCLGFLMAATMSIDGQLLEKLTEPGYLFTNHRGQPSADYNAAVATALRSLFRKQKWFPLSEQNYRYNRKFYPILLGSIFFIIAIALPVHIYNETQPANFSIIDGLPGRAMNVTYPTWAVDCYTTHTPVDKWGFWSYWWSEETKSLAAKVGLL
jgi:hypothetical protein